MKPIIKILLGSLFIYTSCKNENKKANAYFDAFETLDSVAVFAPELALKGNTYKGSFSKDYQTFYFFRNETPNQEDYRIYVSKLDKGKWSQPEKIGFSDNQSDVYPFFMPNSDSLFFTSYRRVPADTSKKTNANFWFSDWEEGKWQKPLPFEAANLIYNYNSQPCVTLDETIYFTSNLPDWSRTYTYFMKKNKDGYDAPQPFEPVNTFRQKDTLTQFFEVCVAPDKTYMILTAALKNSKNGANNSADLFISFNKNGTWTIPRNLGSLINTDKTECFPYITPDGKFLLFTRDFSNFYIIPTKSFINH